MTIDYFDHVQASWTIFFVNNFSQSKDISELMTLKYVILLHGYKAKVRNQLLILSTCSIPYMAYLVWSLYNHIQETYIKAVKKLAHCNIRYLFLI